MLQQTGHAKFGFLNFNALFRVSRLLSVAFGGGGFMQAEVRWLEANDLPDWPHWSPSGSADEHQWFTVAVGRPGSPGADNFQVAVATPRGLRERRRKGKFVGLVVEHFEPGLVERAIRDFVSGSQALTWDGVVNLLRVRMLWEYEGYSRRTRRCT